MGRVRWRRLLCLGLVLTLVLPLSGTPRLAGVAEAQAECDPVRPDGCPLSFSLPVHAILAHGTDLHAWRLQIPAPGRVTFEMLPRQDVDLDLYAVSPSGEVVAQGEREGAVRELSSIVADMPGEYAVYIQINESRDRSVSQIEYRMAVHASPEIAAMLPAPTLGDGRAVALHLRKIVAVAFTPGGDVVATAAEDGAARLWRVADGALVAIVPDNGGQVGSLTFSPDGRLLGTGGRGGTVRLWQFDGTTITPVFGRQQDADRRAPSPRVAFAPDGGALAVAQASDGASKELRTVEVWRVPDWAPAARADLDAPIFGLAFGPDGHALAVTSRFNPGSGWSLRAYDPANLTLLGSMDGIDAKASATVSVTMPVVAPSGELIAVANRFEAPALEDAVRLWRVGAKTFEREIRLPTQKEASPPSLAFSADGQSVVVMSEVPAVAHTFRVSDGAEIASRQLRDRADFTALSSDGRLAAVASGGSARVATLP